MLESSISVLKPSGNFIQDNTERHTPTLETIPLTQRACNDCVEIQTFQHLGQCCYSSASESSFHLSTLALYANTVSDGDFILSLTSNQFPIFTSVCLQTSKRSQSQINFIFGFITFVVSPLRHCPRSKHWPPVRFAIRRFNYSAKAEISLTLNRASHMIDLEAPHGNRRGDFWDPTADKGARCER